MKEQEYETPVHLDVDDALRVNAQGSDFLFHINDQLESQVSDPDYTSGEVGFYVESFDSTHIHFNELPIREFEVSLLCNVTALTLNVRSGPGTTFSTSGFLSSGEAVEPVGISADGEWLKINVEGSDSGGCSIPRDWYPAMQMLACCLWSNKNL